MHKSILWKSNRLAAEYYKRYRKYVTGKIRNSKRQFYQSKFDSLRHDIKKLGDLSITLSNLDSKAAEAQ